MGNENSKETEIIQPNGTIQEKNENGGVNGISISIKANGYTVDVPTKVPTEKNEDPPLPEVKTNSTEYVVLESKSEAPEAEVTAVETPDPSPPIEEIKPSPPIEEIKPSPPTEEIKPKVEKVSLFSKMFKNKTPVVKKEKETESSSEDQIDTSPADKPLQDEKSEEKQENSSSNAELALPEVQTGSTEYVVLESKSEAPEAEVTAAETPDPSPPTEEIKPSPPIEEIQPKEEKVSLFSKMFKKKAAPVVVKEEEPSTEDQTDTSPAAHDDPQPETDNLKQDSESPPPEPERDVEVTEDSGPQEKEGEEKSESEKGNSILEESQDSTVEDNPVMNFFKTLVTPTKTSKKEAPAADATKDQPKPPESQPVPATTVAQVSEPPAPPKGMPTPPPPPPEPPKLDVKAEPAAKGVKATPKEEPKPAAKDSPKGQTTKDTLSRFFRSKTRSELPQPAVEEAQPVEVQEETPEEVPPPVVEEKSESKVETHETADVPQTEVEDQKTDASKASTLEAAAKPEPAPAAQEEKKQEAKSSFLSLFKPKAAEPKASPAPAAAAEPGPAKEEAPKAAKSTEAIAEAKPATAAPPAGEEAAIEPKKLEKRNSIHKFFKNLGQKRHSTDAGVVTEAAPAPSAEKTK